MKSCRKTIPSVIFHHSSLWIFLQNRNPYIEREVAPAMLKDLQWNMHSYIIHSFER